jgi:signal transduction histidine kinase
MSRPRTDLLVAAAVTLAVQLDLWLVEGLSGVRGVTVASALLFTGSLYWRRSDPRVMVALASIALIGGAALGGELTETLTVAATAMLIVFFAASALPRRASVVAVVAFLLASWADLVLARDPEYSLVSDIAFTSMIIVPGPYLAGRALRDRRQRTEELERLTELLRQEQSMRAEMAVLDERSRIAREMHDVVAHSVSLMVVQTGAARSLLDEDPEQSRAALLSVEHAGRQALAELRRALGVMRGGGGADAALTPQPGLAQVGSLVDRARDAGLEVSLTVAGNPQPLPPGPDLAAYRIVQEALTNTVKHAGPATAAVQLRWHPRELELEVTDTGRGPNVTVPEDSHGLLGMRERVAVYGGSVDTGRSDGGGFSVRARIPFGDGAP